MSKRKGFTNGSFATARCFNSQIAMVSIPADLFLDKDIKLVILKEKEFYSELQGLVSSLKVLDKNFKLVKEKIVKAELIFEIYNEVWKKAGEYDAYLMLHHLVDAQFSKLYLEIFKLVPCIGNDKKIYPKGF